MFTKKIKYEDFDGVEREEEFQFHLTKAEIVKWLLSHKEGSLDKVMEKLIKKSSGKEIMDVIEDFIYRSYGEKSADGRKFIKTEEVKNEFMQTEAYSVLFMELCTDAEKASEFITGVIPKDMAEAVAKELKEHPEGIPDAAKDYTNKIVESGIKPV